MSVYMSEHECPTCRQTFDTRRGLGVHHSSAHGRRLPNRECHECGTEFYCDYEKKYCSDECRDEAVSFEAEQNPNYDGSKEQTSCERCGESFEYYPSEKEGLYCSECVETKNWRNPPVIKGDNHPRWNGGKLTIECAICEETVERYPSHVYGEVTFCSDECQHNWLSEEFTGEGHPNWEGGDVGNYGPGWNRVRRNALERDGYECVVCGTTKSDLGRNPDVHHVVPVRIFDTSEGMSVEDAHRLDNVVTLCPPCHRKADFGTLSRERLWAAARIEASVEEILPTTAPTPTGR